MRQKLFDELHYVESSSGTAYGRKLTSDFSLQRMLDGQPEWLQPTILKRKPKTLVIADDLLVFASSVKKAKLTDTLRTLLDKEQTQPPFTIFIWTKKGLRELNEELLNTNDWMGDVIGGKPDEITNAAANKSISKKSLQVIDEYWRDCLFHGDVLPENTLYASELIKAYDAITGPQSGRFYRLSQRKPNCTCIVMDLYEFGKELTKIDDVLNSFPGIPIDARWQELKFSSVRLEEYLDASDRSITNANEPHPGDMQALTDVTVDLFDLSKLDMLADQSPNLERLEVTRGLTGSMDDFKRTVLPNVGIIDLYGLDISIELLDYLLQSCPNVKQLKVRKITGLADGDTSVELNSLKGLHALDIPGGFSESVSPSAISAILNVCSNLKVLDLGRLTDEAPLSLKPQALNNLYTLNLKKTISAQHFECLLNHAKKLKHLYIKEEFDIHGVFHLEEGALVELETIALHTRVSTVMLSEILSRCHKLKHIDLSYCDILQGDIDLATNSLPYVETIDLTKSKISAEVFTKLLKACPNLQTIKFGSSETIASYIVGFKPVMQGELLLEPHKLPHIENLDLSGLDISPQSLNQLLLSCPNILTLNLKSNPHLREDVFRGVSLPLLESVKIEDTSINSEALSALLRCSPNIREVDISNCKEVTSLALEKSFLLNVTKISVKSSAINSHGLQELLNACPNVKQFGGNYISLSSPISLARSSLSQLEYIDLGVTNITMDSLYEFLNASPNLKTLHLSGCDNLETDAHFELGNLYKLEVINFEFSKLPGNGFAAILKASPNIKRLYLDGCKVTGSFTLAPNSLSHLEKVEGFRLSREAREMLARAAPQLAAGLLAEPEKKMPASRSIDSHSLPTAGNSLSQAAESKTPVTPQHDLETHKHFTPHDETKPFEFDATQHVKNQGMLINKLSQYLTVTNKHVSMIPRLQDGICSPLSFYFRDKGHEEMAAFLDEALAWDGNVETLSPSLIERFTSLYGYVERHQLKRTIYTENLFLGDNAPEFLSGLGVGQRAVLTNPWHAIAVAKISATEYCLYDPNGVEGVKTYQFHELMLAINSQLGYLIGIADFEQEIKSIARLANPNQFIAQGGLISLQKNSNFSPEVFAQLTLSANTMDAESLEGLLLRGTSGVPAWVIGTKSSAPRIKKLTLKLLERFKLVHGTEAYAMLFSSMSAMDGMARQALAEELIKSIETSLEEPLVTAVKKDLIALCRRTELQQAYKEELSPWQKSAVTHESVLALKQTLLESSGETVNRLLRCSSDAAVLGLTAQLVKQAGQGDKLDEYSVFYVDGPEDLICASPYVQRHGVVVEFKKGPGGALYDFLQSCNEKNIRPAIVVNYTRFEPEDMVAFNALLDSHDARADGTPLPNKTRVVGFLNTEHPDVYQGSDFYSRFDEKYDNPFTDQEIELEGIRGQGAEEHKFAESDKVVINLYHSADWKSRLLGACVLNGTDMYYEKGELVDALISGAPLEIHNGPWDDPEFRSFWHHLTVGRGVYHAGKWYKMDGEQVVEPLDGYNWEALSSHLQTHVGLSRAKQPVLNNYTLSTFLGGYIYDEEAKGLIRQTGSIDQHKAQTLDVNITEDLSADTWARILSVCKAKGIRLNAHCAPGVRLPTELAIEPVALSEPAVLALDEEPVAGFKVVVSQDRETTLRMLKIKQPEVNVISVSGLSPEDLLTHIRTNFDRANASLSVRSEVGVLDVELAKEKPVILTGVFTKELAQALSAFALNAEIPPNITLLTEDATPFTHLADYAKQHAVSFADKLSVLPADVQTKLPKQLIEAESVTRIEARLKYMAQHPDSYLGDEAWAGMEKLSGKVEVDDAPLDFSTSAAAAEAFHLNRRNSVMSCLADSSYCYLTGLTGVGKTTFVEKTFTSKDGYTLFHEAQGIQDWAQSKAANPVLFLDEANMSEQDWAIFEGLFHEPRRIIIDGVPYPISPDHKLIFAGNPCSYGDERQNNPFFDNYGSAVLCKPLSKAVIYEDILKPVFNDSDFSEADIQAASQDILAAYTMICRSSPDEILMTPRELQMIALLSLSDAKRSGITLSSAVKGNILAVCGSVLENKPFILQRIKLDYATDAVTVPADLTQIPPTFHVTPSLEPILSQVQSLIELRNFRCTQASVNEQQAYGGLGGIVLEGEPGCGKSELMVHALVAAGYAEEHDYINPTTKENLFYKVSASMSLKEKKALLEKAFSEGAVVIMDEINSSPMMEHMLNAMLMGYHPETHARGKPGFMVFGTQNPVSMAGRRVASPALRRRMLAMHVPEQGKEELCAILASKTSLADLSIKLMVETYLERRAYALKNNFYPVPCFRDLEKLAQRTPTVTPASTPQLASRSTTPELTTTEPIIAKRESISKDVSVNQGNISAHEGKSGGVDIVSERPARLSAVGFLNHKSPAVTRGKVNPQASSKDDITKRLSEYIKTRKAGYSFHWDFLGFMALLHWLSPVPWATSRETKVAAATYAKLSVEQSEDALVRFLSVNELSNNTEELASRYKNSYALVTDKKGASSLFYVDFDGNKRQVRIAKTEGLAKVFAENTSRKSYSATRDLLKAHITDTLPTDAQLAALKQGELAKAAYGVSSSIIMGAWEDSGSESGLSNQQESP